MGKGYQCRVQGRCCRGQGKEHWTGAKDPDSSPGLPFNICVANHLILSLKKRKSKKRKRKRKKL
jgi:hypothetical protein